MKLDSGQIGAPRINPLEEFSILPGVRESVLEILFNLGNITFDEEFFESFLNF